ncbi:MAG: hypothetical protein KAU20_04760 [Nanoarchaeota archaeon]|nr:hypothetical protein [Nanoarchaeota archaeon]
MMQRRKPNKADSEYMSRVAALGCIVCSLLGYEDVPAGVHHCNTGMGRKRNHRETIPLCEHHHSPYQPEGYHKMGKEAWEQKFWSIDYLLGKVEGLLQ